MHQILGAFRSPQLALTLPNLLRTVLYLLIVLSQVNAQHIAFQSLPSTQHDLQEKGGYFSEDDSQLPTLIYEAEFLGIDRGILGRAPAAATALANNAPSNLDISPGVTNYYEFPLSGIEGRSTGIRLMNEFTNKDHENQQHGNNLTFTSHDADIVELSRGVTKRQNQTRTIWLSITACQQPQFTKKDDQDNPPQLVMYVSNSTDNKMPGPSSNGDQSVHPLVEGYAGVALNVSNSVYVSVFAPNASILPNILWNYEIAASVDAPYHSFNATQPFLFLVDSDDQQALLVTQQLKDAALPHLNYTRWIERGVPFSVFAVNSNDTTLNGLKHSYCALKDRSPIQATNTGGGPNNIQMGITTRGAGIRQEFFIPSLNRSSTYDGFLAITGNTTNSGGGIVGGGGVVFTGMNFTTKADGNCAVIYNLTFCNEVAYAVPSNPYHYPTTESLSALYDHEAALRYQNFSYSLQQIPCNTTSSAQYSLVRNCDDCAAAYKTWLCAVTIPRCADFTSSSSSTWLQPRNVHQVPFNGSGVAPVTNQTLLDDVVASTSRNNATIAGLIQPGPYKEVLPCASLCYDLVQSCPAALGFACPTSGKGLESSYGRSGNAPDGSVSCNAPGVVYYANDASRLRFHDASFIKSLAVFMICSVLLIS